MPVGEECSAWERWFLQYEECLSIRILVAVPSVLSPEPPAPDSPQVDSALPLLEPRVSGCKLNFVHWPFKRLSTSLGFSPWHTETLLLVTAGCYVGFFPSLCYSLGSPVWVWTPHFSGGTPQLLKYPSRTLAATHGSPASPLVLPLHFLPVMLWWSGFFFCPWL